GSFRPSYERIGSFGRHPDAMLNESRAEGFFAVRGLCIDQEGVREEHFVLTRAHDQGTRSLSGAGWLRRPGWSVGSDSRVWPGPDWRRRSDAACSPGEPSDLHARQPPLATSTSEWPPDYTTACSPPR